MRRWMPALLGGGLLVALLILQVSPVVNPPKWDEYIVAYDAHRLLDGQMPYRDFFNFIPPGAFLFLALLFKAAGAATLTVARYAGLFTALLSAALAASALRRRGWSLGLSCALGSVPAVCLYPFWAVASHQWLAGACFFGLLALLARFQEAGCGSWFLAGLLTGLAGLFLQTGGVGAAALSLVLLLQSLPGRARKAVAWTGGVGAVWVPVGAWLLSGGAGGAFIRDVILWPARNYSRPGNENAGAILQDLAWRVQDIGRHLYGAPGTAGTLLALAGWVLYALLTALGVALACAAALFFWRALRARSFDNPWVPAFVLVFFLQTGFALRGSANWLHFVYLLGPLMILGLMTVEGPGAGRRAWKRMGVALLGLLLVVGFLYHGRGALLRRPAGWEFTDVDRPIREQAVNRFLRQPGMLPPGGTVAAFPEGGEVYLYSAPAAVGYTYLTPLSQHYSTLRDHQVAARQVKQNRPAWILVTRELENDYLDPLSPLGRILLADYVRTGCIGDAVLYRRKAGGVGAGG